MSTQSTYDPYVPTFAHWEIWNRDMTATLPKEMASAANLMAHPLGAAAAVSAVGFGMAGQAAGLWLGTMTAMASAAQRMMLPMFEAASDPAQFRAALAMPEGPGRSSVVDMPVRRLRLAEPPQVLDAAPLPEPAVTEPAPSEPAITESVIAEPAKAVETVALEPAPVEIAVVPLVTIETTQPPAAVLVAPKPVEAVVPDVAKSDGPVQPSSIERPAEPDDLKLIAGIGPKLEGVLNSHGIWTFDQIASWTPQEIAWMDDVLGFRGRIGRDDWQGQAATLSAGKG